MIKYTSGQYIYVVIPHIFYSGVAIVLPHMCGDKYLIRPLTGSYRNSTIKMLWATPSEIKRVIPEEEMIMSALAD